MGRKGEHLIGKKIFHLDFITQGYTIFAEQRDFRLYSPGYLESVTVNGSDDKAAFLVEAQRRQVVVGGNQPQAPAASLHRGRFHRLGQRRTNSPAFH